MKRRDVRTYIEGIELSTFLYTGTNTFTLGREIKQKLNLNCVS